MSGCKVNSCLRASFLMSAAAGFHRFRKSELIGLQLATLSVDNGSPSIESAVWLNSLIHRAWRVKSGGLEPMISSYLSSKLAESFSQPYSKSNGVAHVALDAFTLGSSPPLVSRIECRGVDDEDESKLLMRVDVGMLFHDAVLLLGECMVFPGFVCVMLFF